jgi:predicted P-loop ATPase
MATSPDQQSILTAVEPLVDAGFAIHWLKPRSKAPALVKGWSSAPVLDKHALARTYTPGANVGVRLGEWSSTGSGFVHLIDVDIRDESLADQAYAVLREMLPDYESMPTVRSGSGGLSRHVYFVCRQAYASRKLARSDTFKMVPDPAKGRDVKQFDWEIELFGTGKQAVLPPSIHPNTGRPYEWLVPFDLNLIGFGIGPEVSPSDLESWGARETTVGASDDDDLLGFVRSRPIGLDEAAIKRTLDDLPSDWVEDRETWLQVGMALHHEHQGAQSGFDLWCEWSKRSEKFNERDQKAVWKSFGDYRGAPVRMATLVKAATVERLGRNHDFDDADEDDTPPPPAAPAEQSMSFDDMLGLSGETDKSASAPAINPDNKHSLGPIDPNWHSYLQITEEGALKATLHNVKLLVRNDPRLYGTIAYNAFTQEVVQRGRPGKKKLRREGPKPIVQLDGKVWDLRDPVNGDLWSDSHDHSVRAIIEAPDRQGGYGLKVTDRDLRAATDIVAQENTFHPVQEYLESVEWDGVPRADMLFVRYLGAADNQYHRMAARLFLMGAVTRVFEPGHKFDFVPVLEGLQGKRKSTFARVLAKHESWFAELEGNFDDTQSMVEKMQGAWILELPELQGFSRAEVTTIKGFLSRLSDKVRLAYAKRASVFHRQCVFIGTTNEDQYLRDATGNRRFWPVHCDIDEIDVDRLRGEIDQIWAEIVSLYRTMREQQSFGDLPLYLADDTARAEAEEAQSFRTIETVEQSLAGSISRWLEKPIDNGFEELSDEKKFRTEVCGIEIWEEMLGRRTSDLDQRQMQKIAFALKQVPGWHSAGRQNTEKYGRQRVYRRNTTTIDDLL